MLFEHEAWKSQLLADGVWRHNEYVPIELSHLKTASGYPVLRACFVDDISVEDARKYHNSLLPGGRYEGWGHLIVGNVIGVPTEVRRILASERPNPKAMPPVALVLESGVARLTASLAMRLAGNTNSEWFKFESHAMDWLEQRMQRFLSERAASGTS